MNIERSSKNTSIKIVSSSPSRNTPLKIPPSPQKQQYDDIADLLSSLGLDQYIPAFQKGNVDLATLPNLDEEHFKELGVTIGHRITLKKAIADLGNAKKDEVMKEYMCKIIVVGDVGVGKTSLIHRYTADLFDPNYKATIGVDFCLKELVDKSINTLISVQMWDIAGQERFTHLTRMYYREAKGAFVVFDLTRPKTLQGALKWKEDIESKVRLPNGDVIPVVLLANKSDLLKNNPQAAEGHYNQIEQFAKENGFTKLFVTSAKDGSGIDDAARFLVKNILDNDELTTEQHAPHNITKLTTEAPQKKDPCCV